MSVSLEGAGATRHMLSHVARRMSESALLLSEAAGVFERVEAARFADLGGRDVDTGRLEESLTGRTGDSVRRLEGEDYVFGTNVPYAVFHPEVLVRYSGEGADSVARRLLTAIMETV